MTFSQLEHFPYVLTDLVWESWWTGYLVTVSSVVCWSGVCNVKALENMITWQKVDYDFQYHSQEFEALYNVLVVSQGASVLPVSCLPCSFLFSFQSVDVQAGSAWVVQPHRIMILKYIKSYVTVGQKEKKLHFQWVNHSIIKSVVLGF